MCFSIIAQISQILPLIPQDSSSNASERPWKQGPEGAVARSFLLSFIIHTWVPKSLFFLSVSTGKLPFYSWVFPFSSEKKTSISFFQRREVKVKSTSLFLIWYKWRTMETLWCQSLAHGRCAETKRTHCVMLLLSSLIESRTFPLRASN